MPDHDDNTELAAEDVGPMGRRLEEGMAAKVTETIDGFPASTARERAGIARLLAASLLEYAKRVAP